MWCQMKFNKLQTVFWQSRPGAPIHMGTIVEVVSTDARPRSELSELGLPRNEVSYVVSVTREKSIKLYWPRTRWLALTAEAAKALPRYEGYFKRGSGTLYRRPKCT